MTDRICEVPGCAKRCPGRYRHCSMHKNRLARNGSFDLPPRRQGPKICAVSECETRVGSRGRWCSTHDARWRRTGRFDVRPRELRDDITYRAMHTRVVSQRGKASEHACADCSKTAEQWSYEGGHPDEKCNPLGHPYCTDVSYYTARCRGCHTRRDKWGQDLINGQWVKRESA